MTEDVANGRTIVTKYRRLGICQYQMPSRNEIWGTPIQANYKNMKIIYIWQFIFWSNHNQHHIQRASANNNYCMLPLQSVQQKYPAFSYAEILAQVLVFMYIFTINWRLFLASLQHIATPLRSRPRHRLSLIDDTRKIRA